MKNLPISQRDLIAILALLIMIAMCTLLLISGKSLGYSVDIPTEALKAELTNKAELREENIKSEHEGLVYGEKVEKQRKAAAAKKKAEEAKKAEEERLKNEELLKQIKSLDYVPAVADKIESSAEYKKVQGEFKWNGPVLNSSNGTITGPSGKETYYNLPMGGVVAIMRGMGNRDKYWVRSDGCKMLGNYIMVAANLRVHARGSIVKCSRGYAIVCDTGGFARYNPRQLDLAVNW